MKSRIESMLKELERLTAIGILLYYAMFDEVQGLPDDHLKGLKENNITLPNFNKEYEIWYSESLAVIKQIFPDRLADFEKQYKDERRKEINYITYGISDYLLGLQTSRHGEVIVDGSAAIKKMQIQNSILEAANKRFESSLFDLQEVLQADIFDSELDAARELARKGFLRGGGSIAGVVLEKHLGHVCKMHNLKTRKKYPTISDFNQMLKDNEIIDTAKWRFN